MTALLFTVAYGVLVVSLLLMFITFCFAMSYIREVRGNDLGAPLRRLTAQGWFTVIGGPAMFAASLATVVYLHSSF